MSDRVYQAAVTLTTVERRAFDELVSQVTRLGDWDSVALHAIACIKLGRPLKVEQVAGLCLALEELQGAQRYRDARRASIARHRIVRIAGPGVRL